MNILTRIILIACLFMPVSACRAEEGFKNIRFAVKSYQWWPIVVFVDIKNQSRGGYHEDNRALLRNSGYDEWTSTVPVRNLQPIDDSFPNLLKFDVVWYEVVTKRAYKALIEIDSSQIKPEPLRSNEGILILRIARGGDIQAVTYDGNYPEEMPAVVPLKHFCGFILNNVPNKKRFEINRILSEPLAQEAIAYPASPSEIPSRCT